jgi:hypothetical protein
VWAVVGIVDSPHTLQRVEGSGNNLEREFNSRGLVLNLPLPYSLSTDYKPTYHILSTTIFIV